MLDGLPIQHIDILAAPACHPLARLSEHVDEMASRESPGASHQNVGHGVDGFRANGGQFLSRSERMGDAIGQSIASCGSFHM